MAKKTLSPQDVTTGKSTNVVASFNNLQEILKQVYKNPQGNSYDVYEKNRQNIKGNEKIPDFSKISNAESYMRGDVRKLFNHFNEVFYPQRARGLKYYHLSTIDKKQELAKKGFFEKSNMTTGLIRKQATGLLNQIISANFMLRAIPLSNQSQKATAACQAAVDWAFRSGGVRDELTKLALESILNGPGFVKSYISNPEKVAKQQAEAIIENKTTYIPIYDNPVHFDWISNFGVFFDPQFPLSNGQRYVVSRRIVTMRDALKMFMALDFQPDMESIQYVCKYPKPFLTKDFDKIRHISYYEDAFKQVKDKSFLRDNRYNIVYNNEKVERVEIWTEDTVTVCFMGYLMGDKKNPYKGRAQWHPFYNCNFSETSGSSISEGLGIISGYLQRGYDTLNNAVFDSIKMSVSPMVKLSPGAFINGKKSDTTFPRESWGTIMDESVTNESFLTPPPVDVTAVNFLNSTLEMMNYLIAPQQYSDYQSQSRSARDAILRFEGLGDGVKYLVDSISKMLNTCAQNWLLDIKQKFPENISLPIFDNKNQSVTRKNIKREELEGNWIFQRSSSSIEEVNKSVEKAQLGEFINALNSISGIENPPYNKNGLLTYICSLYNIDPKYILTDAERMNKLEKDSVRRAEIEAEAQVASQQMQAELGGGQGAQGGAPQGGMQGGGGGGFSAADIPNPQMAAMLGAATQQPQQPAQPQAPQF